MADSDQFPPHERNYSKHDHPDPGPDDCAEPTKNNWVDNFFEARVRARSELLGESAGDESEDGKITDVKPKRSGANRPAGAAAKAPDAGNDVAGGRGESMPYRDAAPAPQRFSRTGHELWKRLIRSQGGGSNPNAPSLLHELWPFAGLLVFMACISLALGVYAYRLGGRLERVEATRLVQPLGMESADTENQSTDSAQALEAIQLRLDRLEEQVAELQAKRFQTPVVSSSSSLPQGFSTVVALPPPRKATAVSPALEPKSEVKPEPTPEPVKKSVAVAKPLPSPQPLRPLASPPDNNWVVNLVSLSSRTAIEKLRTEFQRKGVPVQLQSTEVKGRRVYRLQVPGFASREQASAYASGIKKKLGLESVWITMR